MFLTRNSVQFTETIISCDPVPLAKTLFWKSNGAWSWKYFGCDINVMCLFESIWGTLFNMSFANITLLLQYIIIGHTNCKYIKLVVLYTCGYNTTQPQSINVGDGQKQEPAIYIYYPRVVVSCCPHLQDITDIN